MSRFLFVSTMDNGPWGGSEELWSQTAIRLAKSKHEVVASVHHWKKPAIEVKRLAATGVRVLPRTRDRFSRIASKLLRRDLEPRRARRLLNSESPDFMLISCGAYAEDLWWCQACQEQNTPYAILSQAVAESIWPRDERIPQVISAYERAEKVFFVSERNKQLVETMLGHRIPNAMVVRNPFNVDYAIDCVYPLAEPTFNLACVARLEPAAKGQDLLLEVLSQEPWKTRNLKVSFYGKGHSSNGVRALAKLHNLTNVDFPGHVGDISEVWKNHHLLILPSRYEGLPLALVEAMLCSRAAIVTDVAGNTEVLDDNETGFVASAPTVRHLSEAMERAWRRRSDWAQMGIEAARRIRQRVPPDPIGVFTDNLLQLANTSRRR